jgi:hypothetical protein
VPYRADGFVFKGNWASYNRDDCIDNDVRAEVMALKMVPRG